MRRASALAAIVMAACIAPPPAPTAGSTAVPSASPVVAVAAPSCGPVVASTFSPELSGTAYVGYVTCTGTVRNAGAGGLDVLDVWIDQLDASGAPIGSCRLPSIRSLAASASSAWRAVCPVTAEQRSMRVRVTDGSGLPIPTASPR